MSKCAVAIKGVWLHFVIATHTCTSNAFICSNGPQAALVVYSLVLLQSNQWQAWHMWRRMAVCKRRLTEIRKKIARRKLMNAMLLRLALSSTFAVQARSVWAFPRYVYQTACDNYNGFKWWYACSSRSSVSVWWRQIVLDTFCDHDWVENFRMSKETFTYMYLCHQLSPIIHRQNTVMWMAISVEQRVAVTLWFLATPGEYWTIAHLFGLGRSTVCEIVQETCATVVQILLKKYMYIKFTWGQTTGCRGWLQNQVGCSTMCWCYWWLPYSDLLPSNEQDWLLQPEGMVLHDITRCTL